MCIIDRVARLVRASLIKVLTDVYVRTKRSPGILKTRTVKCHALGIALVPFITFLRAGIQ